MTLDVAVHFPRCSDVRHYLNENHRHDFTCKKRKLLAYLLAQHTLNRDELCGMIARIKECTEFDIRVNQIAQSLFCFGEIEQPESPMVFSSGMISSEGFQQRSIDDDASGYDSSRGSDSSDESSSSPRIRGVTVDLTISQDGIEVNCRSVPASSDDESSYCSDCSLRRVGRESSDSWSDEVSEDDAIDKEFAALCRIADSDDEEISQERSESSGCLSSSDEEVSELEVREYDNYDIELLRSSDSSDSLPEYDLSEDWINSQSKKRYKYS